MTETRKLYPRLNADGWIDPWLVKKNSSYVLC